MDDIIESTFNANMDFLDPANLDISTESAGGGFDDLLAQTTVSRPNGNSGLSKQSQDQNPLRQMPGLAADSPAESPDDSSRSSSSESPRHHRQTSFASAISPSYLKTDNASLPKSQKRSKSQLWSHSSNPTWLAQTDVAPSSVGYSNFMLVFCHLINLIFRFMRRDLRSSLLGSMGSRHIRTTCTRIWKDRLRTGAGCRLRQS